MRKLFKYITIGILLIGIYASSVFALEIKKDATPVIYAILVDATDGYTAETDVTAPTVYYVKQGGTATSLGSPTWAELDATNMPGLYSLTLTAGMTDTAGNLVVYISKTGCRTFRKSVDIVTNQEADTYAIASNGTYGNSAIEGLVDDLESRLSATRAGYLDNLTNLDATISSRSTLTAANIWETNISAYSGAGYAGSYLKNLYDNQNWNIWDDATRTLTAGTNIVLAKGTGITGFNDIAAADVWSATPRTLTAGAYSGLTATDIDNIWDELVTGHITASSFAKLFIDNINATIGSRSSHSATDVAALILTTPANKLATDASGRVTVGSNADKTGYSLSQAFPANFSSLAITGAGAVTAGTVSDKTGYSLTQTFPTNFSSLLISALGKVTVGTNDDKAGYSISGTKTTLDALNDVSLANIWGYSSRTLTSGAYAGLTAADITAIWDKNISGYVIDGLAGYYLKNAGGGSSPATIADAVWDELLSGHTTTGSAGKKMSEMPTPYDVGP